MDLQLIVSELINRRRNSLGRPDVPSCQRSRLAVLPPVESGLTWEQEPRFDPHDRRLLLKQRQVTSARPPMVGVGMGVGGDG